MTTTKGAFHGGNNGRVAQHGTHPGYVTHRLYGTDACDACKAAHVDYVKIQRARNRGEDVQLPRLTNWRTHR